MKRLRKKKLAIIAFLVLVEITSIFLMYKSNSDNKTILDDVMLNDNEILSGEMFAIMLEQEDGTYKESDDNTWPTSGYNYDSTRSGCIDANGNRLEGVLTFDSTNNIASVETGNTSYCYLYFSVPKLCEAGTKLGECLLNNSVTITKNIEGGLYRYQGSKENITDNYVCFGTNDKTECLKNEDKYLYRIIGVDTLGNVKLIKSTSLGTNKWHNNYEDDTTWPNSDLFKSLNGLETDTITPIFIDSSTYEYMVENNVWYNKVVTTSWKYGDTTNSGNYDGAIMYAIENGWLDTIDAKVSLMYIHDYYYAYGVGGAPGSYTNAKTAWLFLGSTEWTMSRYGYRSGISSYTAWVVNIGGSMNNNPLDYSDAIRPVFYLISSVEFIDGMGTSTNPITIE